VNLLGGLEIAVYDLVCVEVIHATGDLLGPVEDVTDGQLASVPEDLVQLSVWAVLHDDTVARGLGADTPGEEGREPWTFNNDLPTVSTYWYLCIDQYSEVCS